MLNRFRSGAALAGLAAVTAVVGLAMAAVVLPVVMGWRSFVITSGSMRPVIQPGDVVLARPRSGTSLRPGTVAVFRDGASGFVTHRVVAVNRDGTYRTKGDANAEADSTPRQPDDVVGSGRVLVPSAGLPALLFQQRQWPALAALAVLAAGAVVLARFALGWMFASDTAAKPARPQHRRHRPLRQGRRDRVRAARVVIVALMVCVPEVVQPAAAQGAFKRTTANTTSTLSAGTWVALDATGSAASVGQVATLNWSHTVGAGSNRILVIGVSVRKNNVSVSNITYGGVGGFVQAGTQIGPAADHRVDIWYKLAPPVGTATIALTLSGAVEIVAGSASFVGVNQTTPVGTFVGARATSGAPSVTVGSAAGEVVIGVLSNNADTGTASPVSGQTSLWAGATGIGDADEYGGGETKTGAASVTMSWSFSITNNKWAVGAVPLKPA